MTDIGRVGNATGQGQQAQAPDNDHVVRRGDTLWGIARQHGVSLKELEAANPELARNDFIFPGDRVAIPGRGDATHVVRAGETVSGIAHRHGVATRAIVEANALGRPDLIHPGDRLIVPGGADRSDRSASVPTPSPAPRAAPAPAEQPAAAPVPTPLPADAPATQPPAVQPPATQPAAERPAGVPDARTMFDPNLGSRALGAVVIGQAEGTRTPDGGFRGAYAGHTDPGNGVANRGSFSLQNAGNLTADQADARQLTRLSNQIPAFETAARAAGLDPNNTTLVTGYLDLYNQSPTAAARFLDQIGTLRDAGVTRESVTDLRVNSFVDRTTGERFRLPSGTPAGGGFANIARDNLGRQPSEAEVQQVIRADQARRMQAMDGVISRLGTDAAPAYGQVPTPSPAPRAGGGEIGTVLPATGEGYVTYNREAGGADQVGTAGFVERLQQVGRDWAATGNTPMSVGDMSRAGGGRFAPHSAHQRGTEADIRPFRTDGRNAPVRWDGAGYDQATTRALVETIRARYPDATVLFNDPQLVREGLVRAYAGHDNHLHVRF